MAPFYFNEVLYDILSYCVNSLLVACLLSNHLGITSGSKGKSGLSYCISPLFSHDSSDGNQAKKILQNHDLALSDPPTLS
jgi:hypothetical protein